MSTKRKELLKDQMNKRKKMLELLLPSLNYLYGLDLGEYSDYKKKNASKKPDDSKKPFDPEIAAGLLVFNAMNESPEKGAKVFEKFSEMTDLGFFDSKKFNSTTMTQEQADYMKAEGKKLEMEVKKDIE